MVCVRDGCFIATIKASVLGSCRSLMITSDEPAALNNIIKPFALRACKSYTDLNLEILFKRAFLNAARRSFWNLGKTMPMYFFLTT